MACGGAMYVVWPLFAIMLFLGPFVDRGKHKWRYAVGAVVVAIALLAVALNCT